MARHDLRPFNAISRHPYDLRLEVWWVGKELARTPPCGLPTSSSSPSSVPHSTLSSCPSLFFWKSLHILDFFYAVYDAGQPNVKDHRWFQVMFCHVLEYDMTNKTLSWWNGPTHNKPFMIIRFWPKNSHILDPSSTIRVSGEGINGRKSCFAMY